MTDPTTASAPAAQLGYDDLPRLIALMTGDEKHSKSADSTLDVLWVLYDRVLNVAPATADDPDRDRFLLSKGHGPMAYYAVLAAKGFIPIETLSTFGAYDSPLGYHPDRMLIPGCRDLQRVARSRTADRRRALHSACSAQKRRSRVVVLVGDAELDEGSNHEAIALAGRMGLDRLTVVVVDNRSATYGWPGGIAARFELEGWAAAAVDGRDHDALAAALTAEHRGQPNVVVAQVEKGA